MLKSINSGSPKGLPKKQYAVSELQQSLKLEAYTLGYDGRWWAKPENTSFADRFYIANSIKINDSEANISIYYLFEDPSNLRGFSIKTTTKELLDKDVYIEVRNQVSEWLSPLTDFIIKQQGKNDTQKILNIKIQESTQKATSDDIPF